MAEVTDDRIGICKYERHRPVTVGDMQQFIACYLSNELALDFIRVVRERLDKEAKEQHSPYLEDFEA